MPGTLRASIQPAGVFLSTDGGVTWTPDDRDLAVTEVFGLAIDSQSAVYGRTRSGVFRLSNPRARWTAANVGLPASPTLDILALAVDPRDSRIVYAGTATHGAFKSLDAGQTWRPINVGLSAPEVVAAPADPGPARGRVKLIERIEGPGRPIVEALGIGERTEMSRPQDCNTCRCEVLRISSTDYLELGCACTRMACRTR